MSTTQSPKAQECVSAHVNTDSQPRLIPVSSSLDYKGKGNNNNPCIQEQIGTLRYLCDHFYIELGAGLGSISSSPTNPTDNQIKGLNHIG